MSVNVKMDSSTPSKRENLRRRTLIGLKDLVASSPLLTEAVDDDFERSNRRSIILQKKALTPQVPQSPALNESVKFKGDKDIKEHFQMWTKLHVENKITARVAWQVHIIDLLKAITKKPASDTLQVASTSLDIGAKVYGLRVDDIHAEGLKLANSMARFAQNDADRDNVNDGNDEDDVAGEGERGAPKHKKKKFLPKGPKNTIAKSVDSVLQPLPKLDSMLFSTRIDSNQSTVKNLFTNRLPMDMSCSKFMVLTKDNWWPSGDDSLKELKSKRPFDLEEFSKDGHICSQFQNFVLNKWDPDEEEKVANSTAYNEDVVVFDDQGFPVPELDGPINPAFEEDDGSEDEHQEDEFRVQQMQRDIPYVTDLIEVGSFKRSEYSYNSVVALANGKVIDQIWAGPSHWKLKFLRRSATRYSGAPDAAQKARRKAKAKEPEPVELTSDYLEYVKKELIQAKIMRFKPRINSLKKVTMPIPDSSCEELIATIHEMMISPGFLIVPKSNTTAIENNNNNVNEINNPDLELDDISTHMDHDGMNDLENHEEVVEEVDLQKQNFMGDNLVEAPEYVPKDYISYALQAKKMNMKKLKTYLWQLLTKNSLPDCNTIPSSTFSSLYKNLGNVLPENMKQELSCHLAFSALLHLCNEKTLQLRKLPQYKDFKIESKM